VRPPIFFVVITVISPGNLVACPHNIKLSCSAQTNQLELVVGRCRVRLAIGIFLVFLGNYTNHLHTNRYDNCARQTGYYSDYIDCIHQYINTFPYNLSRQLGCLSA
jgi:hypothetical protein